MPPVDNNTPVTPSPQEPKKGFFAKLFGLGKKDTSSSVVPSAHESQTPPPQLNDTQDPATPGEGALASVPETPVEAVPTAPAVVTPSVETPPVVESTPAPVAPVEPVGSTSPEVTPEQDKPTAGPVPPATV